MTFFIINVLIVLGIPLLGYFWSNRRYVARGHRLMKRWSGRKVAQFLVATGVLAAISLSVLLGGPFYRFFGRQMGLVPGLAVVATVICILILFALYERFLVYLIGVGDYNSRLRARIAAKQYIERRQRQQRKPAPREGARSKVPNMAEQNRQVAPSEMRRLRAEMSPEWSAAKMSDVSPEWSAAKMSDVNNKSGKVIPFPMSVAMNSFVEQKAEISRKMFVTTDGETPKDTPLAELKVLVFNLRGCRIKAKDCGETVLLQMTWTDEKSRERSGEWRLDKNSPDYLWVIERAKTVDVEVAQELLECAGAADAVKP